MPKVLPEYLELRKEQILDAAAACFARRGFHLTTMQDICKEADLSPGAVYRYFPGKEAIIEAMCEHGQNQNAEAMEQAFATNSTIEALNELIRLYFLELENLRDMKTCALTLELITEAPRSEHIRGWLTRSNQDVRSHLAQIVLQAQARGEINPALSPDSIARVMQAVYQGFITQKLVEPDTDPNGYAEVLRALFCGSFWLGTAQAEEVEPSSRAALRH
jgi:TetR/AcrR family transcriptional regulator, repressor for uid operon